MSNKYYNCLERIGTKHFNLKYSFEQHSLRIDTWDGCILCLDTAYLLRCGVLCRFILKDLEKFADFFRKAEGK